MEHTYRPFDADIDRLRSAVTTMGGLVERQLARAVDAVRERDLRLLAQVLVDEGVVNQLHLETDLRCNQTIARRQPIAVDLREIIAVLHINNDLERIGDEAKKIALRARAIEASGVLPIPPDRVDEMTGIVVEMLRGALDAYIRHDADAARAVARRDDEVDSLRDALIVELMERIGGTPGIVSQALAMIFVVQSLERAGDHATNIAEYVVHVVEGSDVRHQPGPRA
jgi:phosphate transport system protein